jgi:hypothetical protein
MLASMSIEMPPWLQSLTSHVVNRQTKCLGSGPSVQELAASFVTNTWSTYRLNSRRDLACADEPHCKIPSQGIALLHYPRQMAIAHPSKSEATFVYYAMYYKTLPSRTDDQRRNLVV